MGIRRGTTPKLIYQLDIPTSNLQAFRIAFLSHQIFYLYLMKLQNR